MRMTAINYQVCVLFSEMGSIYHFIEKGFIMLMSYKITSANAGKVMRGYKFSYRTMRLYSSLQGLQFSTQVCAQGLINGNSDAFV